MVSSKWGLGFGQGMNARVEQRYAAEKLCIRLRWLLLLAAGILVFEHLTNPLVGSLFGLFALIGVYGHHSTSKLARYTKSGARYSHFVRFVDVLGVALLGVCLDVDPGRLAVLGTPIILCEAYVSRSRSRVVCAAVFLAVTLTAVVLANSLPTAALISSAVVCSAGAVAGLVLAAFQSREEMLATKDRRLASILDCGNALATNRNLRDTLLHTVRTAVRETRATGGYVMLMDEEKGSRLVTEAAFCSTGEFEFPQRLEVGFGLSGFVAKMGQPVTVSSKGEDHKEFDGLPDVQSACSVPLMLSGYSGGVSEQGLVLGAMTIFSVDQPDGFSSEDMELLRALASIQAVAVSNARMENRRKTTFLRTMESLATALEARDEYTRGHSSRVCELSLLIGERLGLSQDALEELRVGTILHDIGKIGVPDAILNKRGRLTAEEFSIMKQHPVIGYEICRPLMLSEGVLMIIRNHHEKLDGSGYPDGLKGGELPLSLRIVCVADAFDAMSSRRPYRGTMTTQAVLSELSRCAGTQFDPVIVETLKGIMSTDRIREIYETYWRPEAEAA